RRLMAMRLFVDLDAVGRRDLDAHRRNVAVDLDPALLDPCIGLAARAQAQFGHALVEAHGAGGCGGSGVGHGGADYPEAAPCPLPADAGCHAIPTRRHARDRTLCFLPRACKGATMPSGDKSAYTDKQKRQAEHIEKGYE